MSEDRETEVTHDRLSFAAELRRLADALESGDEFTVDIDGEAIKIPADAAFSIVHEQEDGEVELEFQVAWSLADDEDMTDDEQAEADDMEAAENA
jgi:amphi-Trp domain-containing protein